MPLNRLVSLKGFAMENPGDYESIINEAKLTQEQKLDYKLVKVLSGDEKGSDAENAALEDIRNRLKNKIYIEAIYILTHKLLRNAKLAKELFYRVLDHRNGLSARLGRNIGIEIAALDYMGNIHCMLDKPAIVERDKLIKLAMKAVKDGTTGVYDREVFRADLKYETRRAKRYKRALSILFCDLDDFKKINDSFGHITGDYVLKEIARAIRGELRETDKLYRYGGEEFVCLLPETDMKASLALADRIRVRIADLNLSAPERKDERLTVSISIGAAEFGKDGLSSCEALISAADRMMYKAKRAGKNRVCRYRPVLEGRRKGSNANLSLREGITGKRTVIKGQGISYGYGMGRAFVYKDILSRDMLSYRIGEENITSELKRIKNAIDFALADLRNMKSFVSSKIHEKHAAIFGAHEEMLKDTQLLNDLEQELKRELVNAEQTVKNVFRKWSNKFRAMDSEVHKAKADDVEDLSRKLLQILLGYKVNTLEKLRPNSIIIARRLLPSDTVCIDRDHAKGIIVEHGSKNSHSAILARTMGIPAVANLEKALDVIKDGDELILDGAKEQVIINPSDEDKKYYRGIIHKSHAENEKFVKLSAKDAATVEGERIYVYANVSAARDITSALNNGCDGIGLFRVENLFLGHKLLPTEENLVEYMSGALAKFGDKEVTLRLLDVGGDKRIPHVNIEDELNTYLGLRGVRLLLHNKHLLKTQLKAALRLSKDFKIRVLIPMVTLPEEIGDVRECAKVCREELNKGKKAKYDPLKIGTMIETPAAVICLQEIAKISDFLSIGNQ